MKNFIKILCLIFVVWQHVLSIGGGIFLYRYNQNDVEFLVGYDPYQTHPDRLGFEYLGGTIGDKAIDQISKNDYSNPYQFLRGSIRETLEELAYTLAIILQKNDIFISKQQSPYKKNKINKTYQSESIALFEQLLKQQGIFFIQKKNIFNKSKPSKTHQMTVFFLDVTNMIPSNMNLPQEIVKQRAQLKKQGIPLHACGAEPIAFAWIKGNDILSLLNTSGVQYVPVCQYAQDSTLPAHRPAPPYNPATKTIKLSKACIEMIQDRINDIFNPQQHLIVIKKFDDNIVSSDHQITQQSSSMRAVIQYLQNNPL